MPLVDDNGTIRIEQFDLPASAGWSEQARRVYLRRFEGAPVSVQSILGQQSEDDWLRSVQAFRTNMERLHRRLLDRIAEDFPCDVEEAVVGGVRVEWVTPPGGVRHPDRVLVNLHGGAFVGGAEHCGLVESLPVAAAAGCRVCVVDYRQGWEHRFPAASEDVAAVYDALLADHAPRAVGIFGYSAGGMLTGQAMAWFLANGMPSPGALAICSAGLGGTGDSVYLANLAMGGSVPQADDPSTSALGGQRQPAQFGYAAGVDPADPLLTPLGHPEVLAGFPPTMVLTGSRSFDLSGALLSHRALLAAGVTAELHAWEGMWHCFPYNHRMPEAQDAVATAAGFFDRQLD